MPRFEIQTIGPAPYEEDCAQLGATPNYQRYALTETFAYRAAIIAYYGAPPRNTALKIYGSSHDFGRYYELVMEYDAACETSTDYAAMVAQGLARWLNAGFQAPHVYDARSRVRDVVHTDHFAAAQSAMLVLERLRIDGFGTKAEAHAIQRLRAAYPDQAEEVDQLLRQIAAEKHLRSPADRRVRLYAPYRLTWMPEMFNAHRGSRFPKGDVWDVDAFERRQGERYIVVGIGSYTDSDAALAACWEYLARYVI